MPTCLARKLESNTHMWITNFRLPISLYSNLSCNLGNDNDVQNNDVEEKVQNDAENKE